MKSRIKTFNIALAVGLVFAVLLSMVSFDACCEDLRENVFRLHIIANSDGDKDQAVKLAVRDALLRESGDLFLAADDLNTAKLLAERNVEVIEKIANETLKEYGCDYQASVSISESYFNTRVYDEYTLPAGVYNALKIELGRAEGKNWWCVLFPSICVGACMGIDETASSGGEKIAVSGEKYVVKFKIVEVYEHIKAKILGKI